PGTEHCSASVLEEAFAGVRESGWFPVEQCLGLEQIVRNRSRELGGYLRQLVRMVRLASLFSRSSYLEFFHRGQGGADAFRQLVARANVPAHAILVAADKVAFLEESLRASNGEPFELTFRQMPRLAALLDVMHYTLGYESLF